MNQKKPLVMCDTDIWERLACSSFTTASVQIPLYMLYTILVQPFLYQILKRLSSYHFVEN